MTEDDMRALANTFAQAIRTQDPELLGSITTDEVVWSLPGDNVISGNARGVDAILRRGRLLAAYGVDIELVHVVYGRSGFGLLLHNTGLRLGRILDEHLTSVFQPRGMLIDAVDTYISDVAMLDSYFADPAPLEAAGLEMVDATRSH